MAPPLNTEEDFWEHVDKNGPLWNGTPCWLWTGSRGSQGYGRMRFNGTPWRSHRRAWFYAHGPLPVGLYVCHHCDNPPCCNPAHLFLGTSADNTRDRDMKGRTARGAQPRTETRARGTRNGSARLTEDQVREIRRLAAEATMTQRAIARHLGCGTSQISRIIRRRSWNHLP